jgi:hypothetical protein
VTICYLDPEDEITGAVARIRAVEDGEAVIVLPPGSRIATSRINFRLLAREAEVKGLNLVAVSDEPGVRALAISAGLAAYDSVSAAEKGLREFARQDRRLAERIDGARPAAGPPSGRDRPTAPGGQPSVPLAVRPVHGPAHPVDEAPEETGQLARPRTERRLPLDSTRVMPLAGLDDVDDPRNDRHSRRRRRRRRLGLAPLLVVAMLLALLGVGAYGVYALLPTATVSVRPHLVPVGPVSGVVVADPRVAVVDAGEGMIPAQSIPLPLSVSGQFAATGSRVTAVRATGSVRFRSENTVNEVLVPAGTRVATATDIAFETTAAVTVPRAVFGTGTPGRVDAPVRAVRAGPRGNVAANTITLVPSGLADQLVFVTNPQPTTGGDRQTTTVVTEDDYEAAMSELRDQLPGLLEQELAKPDNAPRGLVVYPATAQIGPATAEPAAAALVDTATESFGLALNATATVLAVNEAHVEQVMVEQLRALVPAGSTLLEQTIEAGHTPGEVSAGTVIFSASANASAYRLPERDVLVEEIRGQPLEEARAIISRYGSAELSVWPDFIDRVPDQSARINLTILPPTEGP